jgi:hypothetical protein
VAQEAFDAMLTQIVLAAVSVGFAAGFEPFFAKALGGAGRTADEVTKIVERFENPAIQAVGTTGNVVGRVPKKEPELPSTEVVPSGSPLVYLSSNLERVGAEAVRLGQGVQGGDREIANGHRLLPRHPLGASG